MRAPPFGVVFFFAIEQTATETEIIPMDHNENVPPLAKKLRF
jgi:hypothetical protein